MDVCKELMQSRDLFGGVPAAQDYLESIQGIDPNDAVAITDMLEEMGPATAEMDALAAREAYLYGYYGIPDKLLSRHPFFYTALPDSRQQEIYDIGKNARDRQIETKWQKIQEKKNAAALTEADEVAGFDEEIIQTEEEKVAALEEDVPVTDEDKATVEKTTKKDIMKVKNSELVNVLPIKGTANSTVDKTDDSGKTLQRRIYGDDGMAMIDVDTSDHGLPKAHPYGAHKHVFDYSKKRFRGNPLPFTEELINYADIIQKRANYHDQK